jgi:hypothetical protein
LKKHRWLAGLIVLVALIALVVWGRNRIHFDFAVFWTQVLKANWGLIVLGIGCIYAAYAFRSMRWAMLIRHNKKVGPLSLTGTQVIGFTAVALIGRVADLVRPYLVAKKTSLTVSSQIAVYIVERLFDAGSMALIFSVAMLSVPQVDIDRVLLRSGSLAVLTAHHPALAAFATRYSGLALTVLGGLFLLLVRLAGNAVAAFLEHSIGLLSKRAGHAVAQKVRAFHAGLDTMRSFSDFAVTASLSLAMWILITVAYWEGCLAFTASPELAGAPFSRCVLLMIASGGASIFQLPVLGWFTQIGIVAAAISGVLGASAEAATACAAILLLVTFLSIIPAGLLWARFEHVSLRKIAAESEQAEESFEDAQDTAGA